MSMERKQAKMEDQSSAMENLPSQILMEIISRLPIKTVMAIGCVSKSFLSLVSDSHFQMLHSTRAPTELLFRSDTRYGDYRDSYYSTTYYICEPVFMDDSLTDVEMKGSVVFDLPRFSVRSETYCNFEATQTPIGVVNSCHGLVCFCGPSGNRFVVICNPITREYVMFPCPVRADKTIEKRDICYGLGFSKKDGRFKLLRVIYRKSMDTDSGEESIKVGEIYTFGKSESWKRVANLPSLPFMPMAGGVELPLFHEGALHWYSSSDDAIVTFDFDTELFGMLETAPHTYDTNNSKVAWSLCMGVFENCIFTAGCDGEVVDMWVLKEYRKGSWVKEFSIPKNVERFSESYEPIKYLQNGETLMFKKHGGMVCYNPDTGSVKSVGGLCKRGDAVSIRPSLVSLKVLLGGNVTVHSVKSWSARVNHFKAAKNQPFWKCSETPKVTVNDVVKEKNNSQGCVPPRSSPEASSSTSLHKNAENTVHNGHELGSGSYSGDMLGESLNNFMEEQLRPVFALYEARIDRYMEERIQPVFAQMEAMITEARQKLDAGNNMEDTEVKRMLKMIEGRKMMEKMKTKMTEMTKMMERNQGDQTLPSPPSPPPAP